MPKLTLLLGRRVMQAYDFKQPSIIVGRDDAADVIIDNPSEGVVSITGGPPARRSSR